MMVRLSSIKNGFIVTMIGLALTACTTISSPILTHYQLNRFGQSKPVTHSKPISILISQPSAMSGYDTESMLYMNKPYQLTEFANNSWRSSPATMLFPLILQSIESSHYFYAVASEPDIAKTDYRLDTQLIALYQDFMVKPSQIHLVVQVTLIHVVDNQAVAETTFHERVPCQTDTPYGGVIAANQATQQVTARMTRFVIKHIA